MFHELSFAPLSFTKRQTRCDMSPGSSQSVALPAHCNLCLATPADLSYEMALCLVETDAQGAPTTLNTVFVSAQRCLASSTQLRCRIMGDSPSDVHHFRPCMAISSFYTDSLNSQPSGRSNTIPWPLPSLELSLLREHGILSSTR